jgi:hypothetical protein
MKKLTSNELFRALRDASQNGTADIAGIGRAYDDFAAMLLPDTNRNTLVYTRAELTGLTGVSGRL